MVICCCCCFFSNSHDKTGASPSRVCDGGDINPLSPNSRSCCRCLSFVCHSEPGAPIHRALFDGWDGKNPTSLDALCSCLCFLVVISEGDLLPSLFSSPSTTKRVPYPSRSLRTGVHIELAPWDEDGWNVNHSHIH